MNRQKIHLPEAKERMSQSWHKKNARSTKKAIVDQMHQPKQNGRQEAYPWGWVENQNYKRQ